MTSTKFRGHRSKTSALRNSIDSSSQMRKNTTPKVKFVQIKQLWEANNSFACFGRFIKGPKSDCKAKYCYWVSFLLIQTLYFLIIAPYLLLQGSRILFLVNLIILVTTITLSLITSYSDPGIIPKYPILKALGNGVISEKYRKTSPDKEKFCKTCKIWRPKRASHCSVCDCCVEVLDHHCPYLNNCIGKRNYKYFIGFLCFISLNGLSIIASLVLYISEGFHPGSRQSNNSVLKNSMITAVILAIIMIATVILFLLLFLLCCFHTYLILKGKTTKEELTKKDQKESKFLSWLVTGRPNFKGGNEWLTRYQYNIYKQAVREIKNNMITENQENLIMSIFHQQRQKMENQKSEGLGNDESFHCPVPDDFHKMGNQNFYPPVEQDFLKSLKERAGRRNKTEKTSPPGQVHDEEEKYPQTPGARAKYSFSQGLALYGQTMNREPTGALESSFQVIIRNSGRKLKSSLGKSSDDSGYSISCQRRSADSLSKRVSVKKQRPNSITFYARNGQCHDLLFENRWESIEYKSEPLHSRSSLPIESCTS